MLKLKKAIFALVSLLALVLTLDGFIGSAQTQKGGKKKVTSSQSQRKGGIGAAALPPRPGINYARFEHTTHSLSCEECHDVKVGNRVTKFPYHPACEECHAFVPFTFADGGAFCLICHETPKDWRIVKPQFPDQKDDQFGIKFPHDVHVGLKAKDYNVGNVDILIDRDRSQQEIAIQETAAKFGCNECHVKEGKDKKEENFSTPHHPECARCHGVGPKNELPHMYDCLGCHKPWMPIRKAVNFLVPNFRHDKDHDLDTRPEIEKKLKEEQKKSGKKPETPKLDCKFCHKQTSASKRLFDLEPPMLKACEVCHSKDGNAHELTPAEAVNMKR
ncbi:MAG: hypothetical protein AB1489_04725 [Acidobacteriota bacterium]